MSIVQKFRLALIPTAALVFVFAACNSTEAKDDAGTPSGG